MANAPICLPVLSLRGWLTAALLGCLLVLGPPIDNARPGQKPERGQKKETVLIERLQQQSNDDLPEIKKRRLIRVLVTYSKTNFFSIDGTIRGFEYELLKNYEKYLNRNVKDRFRRIKMAFIPVPFDRLLPALIEGRGDIAAAGLTITKEREKRVQFTRPYLPKVKEVVVHHRGIKKIESLAVLSGQSVYVRPKSSYVTHLTKLNRQLAREKKPAIKINDTQRHLATEDILEMVNAGVMGITVADHHIAGAWAEVLPDIVVKMDLAINADGAVAWAVRKENPELLKDLNAYVRTIRRGTLLGNIFFNRYYRDAQWVKNPTSKEERKKLEAVVQLLKRYAKRYDFDWLAIAAQAYQESGLDHSKKSAAGAVGIMQILESTAASNPINIDSIHKLENNIHAGVKYLNFLRNRYFNDPAIAPAAQVDFAWAAYNAGPAKINRLRRMAKKRGFDPNKWFYHVEKIAAEVIGRETVQYVDNINKYYVAYRLLFEASQKRAEQKNTATDS